MNQATPPSTPPGAPSSGLAPNVAACLCYVCFFITGIVFLLIEKQNREVQFHAWQSIFLSVAYVAAQIALSVVGAVLGAIAGALALIFNVLVPIIWLAFLIFWVLCLIKSYQGEHYKLPVIGDLAEKQVSK